MRNTRRQLTAEFKAKVAIAAIRGDRPLRELATEFGVHPNQISEWKRVLLGQSPELFAKGAATGAATISEAKLAELYEQIGRQQVELEWLKKKSGR
jgi:transposase-like protein